MDWHTTTFRTLIANLIGDEDRITEIRSFNITERDLPINMKLERLMLRELWHIHEREQLPTAEVMEAIALANSFSLEQFQALMAYRTDGAQVLPHATGLSSYLSETRMSKSLNEALAIVESPLGPPEDRWERALAKINEGAPRTSSWQNTGMDEMMSQYQQHIEWQNMLVADGKKPGPSFEWPGIQTVCGYMSPGDMWLLDAKSKDGKTAHALKYAIYNAHHSEQGYDVVYFLLETAPWVMLCRMLAALWQVPIDALLYRHIDIFNDPIWSDRRKMFLDDFETKNIERGRLDFVYKPGASIHTIVSAVTNFYAPRAEANNHKLIAVIDYLNITGVYGLKAAQNKTELLDQATNLIKDMTEEHSMFTLLLSQFNLNSDVWNKANTQGSSAPVQRSQLHIRLERDIALTDDPFKIDGKQQIDTLKHPMYHHRKGERSSLVKFHVMRGNNTGAGSAAIRWVNAYFMAADEIVTNNN